MAERSQGTVVPFPVHRRSTLDETLHGYAGRTGADIPASRDERRVTMLFAELRGWPEVAGRAGGAAAAGLLEAAVAATLGHVHDAGGAGVTIGGSETQPVLSATFEGPDHAGRALTAALRARDAVGSLVIPGLTGHAFRLCAGVNTGQVVQTEVSGGRPVAFQALGTVRMFATRLQEFAGPDQVFLAGATLADVPGARARSVGQVRTNADGGTAEAFCLLELQPNAAKLGASTLGARSG